MYIMYKRQGIIIDVYIKSVTRVTFLLLRLKPSSSITSRGTMCFVRLILRMLCWTATSLDSCSPVLAIVFTAWSALTTYFLSLSHQFL